MGRVLRTIIGVLALSGCSTTVSKPCSTGGQSPREGPQIKGTKQCIQMKDRSGKFINHGRYIEWHPNGKRALEGEYKGGLKTGKWSEWDDKGHLLNEKWFEDGVQVSTDRDH